MTRDDEERVGRQTGGHPLAVLCTTDVAAAVACVQAAGACFAHVADLYGNEVLVVQLAVGARR